MRWLVFALAALVSCKPSIKGNLEITADGNTVPIKSALYVPSTTAGFRVQFSSDKRDCEWAKASGLGAINRGEVLGSLDVAPVIGPDGVSHWRIVGAGYTSDSHAAHEVSGNVGNVGWLADVTTASGCDRHIKVANDEDKQLHVHGDFDVICCGAAPPPPAPPPMTAKLGGKTFPLTTGWAREEKGGGWHVRLSNGLRACADDVTGADLFVDLDVSADWTTTRRVLAGGQVLPPFGYDTMSGPFPMLTRVDDQLELHGSFHATLDTEIQGRIPLSVCK